MSLWGNKFGTALCENGFVVLELCTKKLPFLQHSRRKTWIYFKRKVFKLRFRGSYSSNWVVCMCCASHHYSWIMTRITTQFNYTLMTQPIHKLPTQSCRCSLFNFLNESAHYLYVMQHSVSDCSFSELAHPTCLTFQTESWSVLRKVFSWELLYVNIVIVYLSRL